jgi:hypothetical protein
VASIWPGLRRQSQGINVILWNNFCFCAAAIPDAAHLSGYTAARTTKGAATKGGGKAIRRREQKCQSSKVVLNPVAACMGGALERRTLPQAHGQHRSSPASTYSTKTVPSCRCMLTVLIGCMQRRSFELPRSQDGCDSSEMWWIGSDKIGPPQPKRTPFKVLELPGMRQQTSG